MFGKNIPTLLTVLPQGFHDFLEKKTAAQVD